MDQRWLNEEALVLVAALASAKQLNICSLIFSTICLMLFLFSQYLMVNGVAGLGIIVGVVQLYFNWRVALDKELLPLLIQLGEKSFDRAFEPLFPGKTKRLAGRDLCTRIDGARTLFRSQCYWLILQLVLTIGAVGGHLYMSVFI